MYNIKSKLCESDKKSFTYKMCTNVMEENLKRTIIIQQRYYCDIRR